MIRTAFLAGVALSAVAFRSSRNGAHSESKQSQGVRTKLLPGAIDMPNAAFLFHDVSTKSIMVSRFGVGKFPELIAKGQISKLPVNEIAVMMKEGALRNMPIQPFVESKILWPNKVTKKDAYYYIPDGFLTPNKEKAGIWITDGRGSNGTLFQITGVTSGFYHEVKFFDFDGDGNLDILTARTNKGLVSFSGELLWYRNPGPAQMTNTVWKETKIANGPDVSFYAIPHRGGYAVFSSNFFSERLMITFLTSTGTLISQRIIDDKVGKAFGVEMVDLDGDGNEELLVTNHQNNINQSAVFAYDIPAAVNGVRDLENGAFTKTTLATNIFKTVSFLPGAASPGYAIPFYPRVNTPKSQPKHIVVAGDGSLDVWYLRPVAGQRLKYEAFRVADFQGTTGAMTVGDFDGDGINDVLVPNNDKWNIRAFTFEGV